MPATSIGRGRRLGVDSDPDRVAVDRERPRDAVHARSSARATALSGSTRSDRSARAGSRPTPRPAPTATSEMPRLELDRADRRAPAGADPPERSVGRRRHPRSVRADCDRADRRHRDAHGRIAARPRVERATTDRRRREPRRPRRPPRRLRRAPSSSRRDRAGRGLDPNDGEVRRHRPDGAAVTARWFSTRFERAARRGSAISRALGAGRGSSRATAVATGPTNCASSSGRPFATHDRAPDRQRRRSASRRSRTSRRHVTTPPAGGRSARRRRRPRRRRPGRRSPPACGRRGAAGGRPRSRVERHDHALARPSTTTRRPPPSCVASERRRGPRRLRAPDRDDGRAAATSRLRRAARNAASARRARDRGPGSPAGAAGAPGQARARAPRRDAAGVGVRLERLRLPARPVEGEHQLRPERSRNGSARTSSRSSPTSSAWRPAARSASIRASTASSRASSQPRYGVAARTARPRGRRAARPRQRSSADRSASAACSGRPSSSSLRPSSRRRSNRVRSSVLGGDRQEVPGARVDEHVVRLERLPQARDVLLERGRGIVGRIVPPQLLDQAVARDDRARLEQQQGEDASLLDAAQAKLPLALPDLERTEDAEVEACRQRPTVPRRPSARLTGALSAGREAATRRSSRAHRERRRRRDEASTRIARVAVARCRCAGPRRVRRRPDAGCRRPPRRRLRVRAERGSTCSRTASPPRRRATNPASTRSRIDARPVHRPLADRRRATHGSCWGTYAAEGTRVTFRFAAAASATGR